jgi:hypothetical protein
MVSPFFSGHGLRQVSQHDTDLLLLIKKLSENLTTEEILECVDPEADMWWYSGHDYHHLMLKPWNIKRLGPPSIIEIRNKLRALYAQYARTKDKNILSQIKDLVQALNKSTLLELKKQFRKNKFTKKRIATKYPIDQRKKIRSFTLSGTEYFTCVSSCEENSSIALSMERYKLFSKQHNTLTCTTKKNRLNQLMNT